MNKPISSAAGGGSLRQRLIDDMNMCRFSPETQRNYIRDVGRFATFVGRSPDTATAEGSAPLPDRAARGRRSRANDEQHRLGAAVLLHEHASDRPDLARKLVRVTHPRKLPVVLSPDEVARLLSATTCLKHQAALSVAWAFEPRPIEGHVGDPELPHRGARRPCRWLPTTAATFGSPTILVATGIVRSAKTPPRAPGSPSARSTCCRSDTSMSSSRCRPGSPTSPGKTRRSSTTCCSGPPPRR